MISLKRLIYPKLQNNFKSLIVWHCIKFHSFPPLAKDPGFRILDEFWYFRYLQRKFECIQKLNPIFTHSHAYWLEVEFDIDWIEKLANTMEQPANFSKEECVKECYITLTRFIRWSIVADWCRHCIADCSSLPPFNCLPPY